MFPVSPAFTIQTHPQNMIVLYQSSRCSLGKSASLQLRALLLLLVKCFSSSMRDHVIKKINNLLTVHSHVKAHISKFKLML